MIRYIEKKILGGADPAQGRKTAGVILSAAGIGFNILLFVLKAAAGKLSGSIAITADSFNNLADSGNCAMALLGFALAHRKPCRKYPFGCGRLEYLSGLLISAAVLILGIRMLISSVSKMIRPDDIKGSPHVILILVISIAVKGYMYLYNSRIGKRISSAGMKAAAVDSLSDCAATLAIIISLAIEGLTGVNIDGYAGAAVALCIIWAGVAAAEESVAPLMGKGIDEAAKERIENITLRYREITAVYGIAIHDYGPQKKLLTMYVATDGAPEDTIRELKKEIEKELGHEAFISIGDKEKESNGINSGSAVKNNSMKKT